MYNIPSNRKWDENHLNKDLHHCPSQQTALSHAPPALIVYGKWGPPTSQKAHTWHVNNLEQGNKRCNNPDFFAAAEQS